MVVCIHGTTPHWSTGIQLSHLEVFVVTQYFSSAIHSQLPKGCCSSSVLHTVYAHPAFLMWMHVSNSGTLQQELMVPSSPSGLLLLHLRNAQGNTSCLPLPPYSHPKKATTPVLCMQWTHNEHLLIPDIAKYQADRRWIRPRVCAQKCSCSIKEADI